MSMTDFDIDVRHRDAIADTHDTHTAFHGWVLSCLWCNYQARGRTQAEALARLNEEHLHPMNCYAASRRSELR